MDRQKREIDEYRREIERLKPGYRGRGRRIVEWVRDNPVSATWAASLLTAAVVSSILLSPFKTLGLAFLVLLGGLPFWIVISPPSRIKLPPKLAIALIITGTVLFIVGLIYNLTLTLAGILTLGAIGAGLALASRMKRPSCCCEDEDLEDLIAYYYDDRNR